MHLQGQRHQEFRDFILELALLFKPHTYCEIGVRKGYVYNTIAPHVERAIAVEMKPIRGLVRGDGRLHFQMTSEDFARKWAFEKNPTIDLLLIDADHRYNAVMNDFANLQAYVPNHTGIILLHDTYPVAKKYLGNEYCSDAWRAAKEIREHWNQEFEIVTLPGPRAGLSIIRKAMTHGWMDKDEQV